ncbi:hypothetical protein HDV06_002618 [Boothiomyces sp. JEL0866]|nr:hypothetical protein HDV06_002618 [Boothiomyces sp. JEL0866]
MAIPAGYTWNDYLSNEVFEIQETLYLVMKSIVVNMYDFSSFAAVNLMAVMGLMIFGLLPLPFFPLIAAGSYGFFMSILYYRRCIPSGIKREPGFLKKFFYYGQLFPAVLPLLYFICTASVVVFSMAVHSSAIQILFILGYELLLVPILIYIANYAVRFTGEKVNHLEGNHLFILTIVAKFGVEIPMDIYYMFLFMELHDWYVFVASISISNIQILLELFHYEETTVDFFIRLICKPWKGKPKITIDEDPNYDVANQVYPSTENRLIQEGQEAVQVQCVPLQKVVINPVTNSRGYTIKKGNSKYTTSREKVPLASQDSYDSEVRISHSRTYSQKMAHSIAVSKISRIVDHEGRFLRIEYYMTSVLKRGFSCLFALCLFPLIAWGPDSKWSEDFAQTDDQNLLSLFYVFVHFLTLFVNLLIAHLYIKHIKKKIALNNQNAKELDDFQRYLRDKVDSNKGIKKMLSFSLKKEKKNDSTTTFVDCYTDPNPCSRKSTANSFRKSSPTSSKKSTPTNSRSPSPEYNTLKEQSIYHSLPRKQVKRSQSAPTTRTESLCTLPRKESKFKLPDLKDPIKEFNYKTRQQFPNTSCNPQYQELIQYTNLLVEIFDNPQYNNDKNKHLLNHIKMRVQEWNNDYEINLGCLKEIKELLVGLEKQELKKEKFKLFRFK